MRTGLAECLDRFAADWNARLPELLEEDRAELRALIDTEVSDLQG